ncbi:PREDICTED: uncharacterized protein LOC106338470 [Brassica oleracea var. oleracea]|uniref:uncharacterized protein LOC106338470 n=1 Tax=Brassica oleracea var. oleracea TaxID=109376 RepID=UPI0006A75420|nr:PREDICTED: uncharacterized protein LOC106338470 [Brassica oleracea var. oleracea]
MGGSPPSGDSVRSVKDYRLQVATSQKWPTKPTSYPPITFSPNDAEGVHAPHNDPLLVVLGIGEYDVTKILIDTGSSVDLIFRGTLQKMGVDLDDVKASSRTLTEFNGSSETILGTIRLLVRACGVTRTVKFAVVSTKAPCHAILGTPWLHSMQAVPSTYHQCVKFPGTDGRIKTLRGDQKAARDLLVATVKLQRSSLPVNSVSPPTSKFCSQESEVLELPIDDADQSRTVRVGAILSEEMQQSILDFLRKNVSTFAWSMADMKGIDPTITTHELNVDPTFKPIRQKRLVKKKNGKWRVCVDFTDLNKACPKDSYPLPNIDRLDESTAGNEMLTFMDAFSRYNQIMMHPDDREKTAFITDKGTYCYKVMPFGLKNAGATYQRLVNKMFADKLGITMEVYIDDMLVKSLHATDHLRHLQECFETLNKYGMKLNPAKCTFGVSSGEFLGYIVTQRGIEANPQSKYPLSTDKCLPFYDLLRGNKRFIWDEKCEDAFTQLKQYLTTPPVLAKPDVGDVLSLYVAVSQAAVSSVLLKEDRGEQKPIFYTSRRMTGPETRYPTLEKMALAVVEAARKLRPYFQSHSVELKLDAARRWIVDHQGSGCQSPTTVPDRRTNQAVFQFWLSLIKQRSRVRISDCWTPLSKSRQFSGDYDARNDRMDAYLKIVQSLAAEFEFFELIKVPRGENVCADALAAPGSKLRDQVKRTIPIHRIEKPSIDIPTDQTLVAPVIEPATPDDDGFGPDWRTEFIDYLSKGELPTEKWAAHRLKTRSAHYVVLDDELHRWTASKVLLKCIHGDETARVMAETHEGAGGNHSGGRALAIKVRSLGFFWPTMNADCESYARSCDKCQPEAYAQVTDKEVRGFVWKNIICRHGLPYEIVTVNGSQFMSGNFKEFCGKWNIRLSPSTPRYPQGNGQAESSNKLNIDGIKKRLDLKKGHWADELDGVLWSHRTTPRG